MGAPLPYVAKQMVVTGPVPGYNTPVPSPQTSVGKQEAEFLATRHITPAYMAIYEELLVYGLRRALRVYPTATKLQYIQDDLIIDFTLPSGSYASVLVDLLLVSLRQD
ncbi:MAG: tRNA pseudouridine(13) synthase TruD [Candidatus Peribacteria bacterium]|nr:MAG: tRNA pseudouridine(13) synthase TruD [Candidatus Peribacteria bacterium]